MSNRKRLTWNQKGATEKEASPAPQVPANARTEESDHPAAQEDAAYEKYKSGDPSAWAEDVHPGPYDNSPAPAIPGMQEPADHPAAKPGKPMSASDVRKAAEKKAAKCIRVATALIGETNNFESEADHTAAIEDQALDLMDLPDGQLNATLSRLGMDEDEDEDENGSDKEASVGKMAAFESKLATVEGKLDRILKAMNLFSMPMDDGMLGMDDDMMDDDMMLEDEDDEGMLDEMLADEHGREMNDPSYGFMAEEDDMGAETMLEEMLAGRGMMAGEEEEEEEDEEDEEESESDKEASAMLQEMLVEAGELPPALKEHMKKKEEGKSDEEEESDKEASEEDIVMAAEADPMGLMDTSPAGDSAVLDQLYHLAGDNEEEEEEEDDEEDDVEVEIEEKAGGKKASGLRPQPKKTSRGVQSVGAVSKVASSEVSDLSSLWAHAPDVSDVFNS